MLVGRSISLRLLQPAAKSSMPSDRQTATRACDLIALAVLGAVSLVALLTFRDYGLSWDDYAHAEYGDLLLALYTSGFADKRALSFVNLYYYGGGFDLPVLHHRSLVHGVTAARYWEWGDDDRDFRYNNYLGRYHTRHIDLMDVLAAYQPRAAAGLDAMARLCGFPGKLGMDGSEVAAAVAAGRIDDVRRYCETDVMNTYLLYQRFLLLRGVHTAGEYAKEISLAREKLAASGAPHWREYIDAWDANADGGG